MSKPEQKWDESHIAASVSFHTEGDQTPLENKIEEWDLEGYEVLASEWQA